MTRKAVVIPKTWRSEARLLGMFLLLSLVCLYLTRAFPSLTFSGPLFSLFGYQVALSLPLFWFLPVGAGSMAIYRIYNVRFVVDSRGIEAKIGILAVHQRITRVRFEDVRSVETEQSILDRFFNIGDIEIGTAATGDVEIVLEGVAAPVEVQRMIQAERDRRQQLSQQDKALNGRATAY